MAAIQEAIEPMAKPGPNRTYVRDRDGELVVGLRIQKKRDAAGIGANLAKLRDVGFDRVVFVATSLSAVAACQRALQKADLEKESTVELLTWLDVS